MWIKILEIIFTGAIGAFSAYLFNLFHWKRVEKIRLQEQKISSILKILEQVRVTAIKYWSSSYTDDEATKIQDEALIKILLLFQNRQLLDFCSNYQDSMMTSELHLILGFSSEIFDLITGEDFESKSKPIDHMKCKSIASKYYKVEVIFRLL